MTGARIPALATRRSRPCRLGFSQGDWLHSFLAIDPLRGRHIRDVARSSLPHRWQGSGLDSWDSFRFCSTFSRPFEVQKEV